MDTKETKETFHVFDYHDGKRGSKCFTVEFDKKDAFIADGRVVFELKTNERLPNNGIIFIPDRNNDDNNMEFEFKLQGVSIPNYNFGVMESSMTDDVKTEWESLPKKQNLECGNFSIECHKEIIDTSIYSIFGVFQVYIPRFVIINISF
jgi:hypothetical protein